MNVPIKMSIAYSSISFYLQVNTSVGRYVAVSVVTQMCHIRSQRFFDISCITSIVYGSQLRYCDCHLSNRAGFVGGLNWLQLVDVSCLVRPNQLD